MPDYASELAVLEAMTPEERRAHFQQEERESHAPMMAGFHEHIELCEWFIDYCTGYIEKRQYAFLDGVIDEATLRKDLQLAIDCINGNKETIKTLRRDIAHYSRYPLGTQKRRDYIKQQARRG